MATESPIRIMETGGKWPPHNEAAAFGASSATMTVEELGLLLKGQSFQGKGRDVVLNRSGSAPPSIEGSFAAIENLRLHHNNLNASLASHTWENQRQVHRISSIGSTWGLTSFDDFGNGSFRLHRNNLPTHEEESEDDRSPVQPPDHSANRSLGFWSEQGPASSLQHKSIVDLLQEDFPRTPSPVYNPSHPFSHESVEEAVDYVADSSYQDPSINTLNAITATPSAGDMGQLLHSEHPTVPAFSSSSLDSMGVTPGKPPLYRRQSDDINVKLEDDVVTSGPTDSDIRIEPGINAMNISSFPNPQNHKYQKDWQVGHQNNMLHQQVRHQPSSALQVQGVQSQMISQEVSHGYTGSNQFLHAPPNLSAAEIQTMHDSSGFTSPLYATTAAYMSSPYPFYPNLPPSGYFSPQYSVGGYAINPTAIPPFVAGYPPHSAVPVAFDGPTGPNFSAHTAGVSTGGSHANGVDMQHLSKFYGQLGYAMQPSFTDPLYMPYLHQPFWDAYNVSGQFDHLVPKDGAGGSQISALDSRKRTEVSAYLDDQKLRHSGSVGHNNMNPRKGVVTNPCYFGGPTNMGVLMQLPTSPLASPVLPGSPVGSSSFPGGRNEGRFQLGSGRNAGIYPGWQGEKRLENFDDNRTCSFLEELKSGKGRRFELSDIGGHIVEFSTDQHGSRFIQQKLENCSVEEKASVFIEIIPNVAKLMTDVFGNYVIQKFFEYGSPEQRKELANQLEGQILPLSVQMYGCRVIQKALDVIELEQKTKLVCELDGHVVRCVRDQNGNHVIQKCIESIPTDKIEFVISSFRGQVATLSTHPYGCRVIQRVLEHCTDESLSQFIVDEILVSVCALSQDQYGNYVTQHVLERGKPHERSQIIDKLSGRIVQLSQHKFASNVIEKCLEYGDSAGREILIEEIIGREDGNDDLLALIKDQYANYVVQKTLQICTEDQREMLFSRIRNHLNALKKYTYGKHIVARFEQLYGEEIQTSGS